MIIVEQSEVRKTQLHNDPNVAVATSSTPLIPAESPPAYTPREGSGPSALPEYNPPPPPGTQKRRPRHVAKRFAEALFLAFGAYMAIASLVKFLAFMIDTSLHDVRWTRHLSYSAVTSDAILKLFFRS